LVHQRVADRTRIRRCRHEVWGERGVLVGNGWSFRDVLAQRRQARVQALSVGVELADELPGLGAIAPQRICHRVQRDVQSGRMDRLDGGHNRGECIVNFHRDVAVPEDRAGADR